MKISKNRYEKIKDAFRGLSPDLQNNKSIALVTAASFIALFLLAIIVRKSLIGFENADYTIFSSWYDYVKLHGLSSFSTNFSNYNPPYTYFLYLITLVPVSKIVAIKGLMIVFDLLLAFSVYLVVRKLRPGRYLSLAAAAGTMFLPTVLSTGVFWGQFDQFYTAFILFSLYYVLKDNSKLAWVYFGIAIAIKLQAIFFLPVLVIMMFKRIKWWDAGHGLVAFIILTFLPMLAGRSFGSILDIYVAQTNLFHGNLTLNAPNIYTWVPNSAFEFLNSAGIYLTAAAVGAILVYSLIYKKYSDRDVVVLTALMLFLVPFLLPQMHERYFFPATIASFILALLLPRMIWVAVTMQVTTIFSYVPFLFGQQPPITFPIMALIGVGMIGAMMYVYHGSSKRKLFNR